MLGSVHSLVYNHERFKGPLTKPMWKVGFGGLKFIFEMNTWAVASYSSFDMLETGPKGTLFSTPPTLHICAKLIDIVDGFRHACDMCAPLESGYKKEERTRPWRWRLRLWINSNDSVTIRIQRAYITRESLQRFPEKKMNKTPEHICVGKLPIIGSDNG